MALSTVTMTSTNEVVTLDPFMCIPKRNTKYARDCTEVYLTNRSAEAISDKFKIFENLEVVWFSGNHLSRITNLESNFRIREVYLQDNCLVSLAGLKNLKFLQVLMASNNQLRNLDKQLGILKRFAFLKKLDLFGNPVADEPDYRLRIVYNLPQVDVLDRSAVKRPERMLASEVVPNMDKVCASKPESKKKIPPWLNHTRNERLTFRLAGDICSRLKRESDDSMGGMLSRGLDRDAKPPGARHLLDKRVFFQEQIDKLDPDQVAGDAGLLRETWAGRNCVSTGPLPFSKTLSGYLGSEGAKFRSDVYLHTFFNSWNEMDEFTGLNVQKTSRNNRLISMGSL